MSRKDRASEGVVAAGELLFRLLASRGLDEKMKPYRAWAVWREAVGEQVASKAHPFRFRDGVLEVRVESPVWMQQLQFLKPRILARLHELLGDDSVREIFLRRGRPESPAGEASPARRSVRAMPLDSRLVASVEQAVEEISDTELRDQFRKVLLLQARLDKSRTSAEESPQN